MAHKVQPNVFVPSPELAHKLSQWAAFHKEEGAEMNSFRAAWAQGPLEYFSQLTGSDMPVSEDEPGDALSDLLGDLMHYADQLGISFNDELARARGHYREELADAEEN